MTYLEIENQERSNHGQLHLTYEIPFGYRYLRLVAARASRCPRATSRGGRGDDWHCDVYRG
jgi:hypothetical protein